MAAQIKGGFNIAMKVPSHQYEATLDFYRDVIGLKPFDEKAPAKGFELGPNRLWIDEAPMLSQAEVWLELFTDDHDEALERWLRRVLSAAMRSSRSNTAFAGAGS